MSHLFLTYALIKALYEKGQDYIDCFWPLMLKVLPKDGSGLEITIIQSKIKDNSIIEIPQHALSTIITRSTRNGYSQRKKNQVFLLTKGLTYLNKLEPETDTQSRINELIDDFRSFVYEQRKETLAPEKIQAILLSFVNENIETLVEYCNKGGGAVKELLAKKELKEYENTILNYFEIAEKRKPNVYKTITDIIFGSVISTLPGTKDFAEASKKFEKTQVFLDSNFLFWVLDLHHPAFCTPAKELLGLLKNFRFDLRVFDFTIDEIVRVLKGYIWEQQYYYPGVKVNTIHSSLKSRGWTIEDVKLYISKIEVKISEIGASIVPTKIVLKDYKPNKVEYISKLNRYKPNQNVLGQNHDLAAIEEIQTRRKTPRHFLETADYLFLTSDLRLSKFDLFEMGHRDNQTICEVISDKLLTTILWLKSPNLVRDVPLKTILAIHSRELLINKVIWGRFYENLKKLRFEGKIDGGDITMLFYNHYIEDVLRLIDETQVAKINAEFIMEEIQKAEERIDEKTRNILKKQQETFAVQITQKEKEAEERTAGEVNNIIEQVKEKLKEPSRKRAHKLINLYTYPLTSATLHQMWPT
jgi:hypothetical protein